MNRRSWGWNPVETIVKRCAGISNARRTCMTTSTFLDVIVKTHQALAKSPAVVTLASLEDGLAAEIRPNLPSAHSDKRPNWRIPLPKKLEEIETRSTGGRSIKHLKR